MMRVLLIIAFMVCGSNCLAAVEMDSTRVIEVSVSDQGLTRISVQKQTIADVFMHPANLNEHVNLHKSGHVFLAPDGLEGPIYLTIITDSGQTQDLKISFTKKASQPLILQTKQPVMISTAELRGILASFVAGHVPNDFTSCEFVYQQRKSEGINFALHNAWSDGNYLVYRFWGKNTGSDSITLKQQEFSNYGDLAVVLDKHTLKPGEHGYLYIIRRMYSTNIIQRMHSSSGIRQMHSQKQEIN